jgi:hypothetical protein
MRRSRTTRVVCLVALLTVLRVPVAEAQEVPGTQACRDPQLAERVARARQMPNPPQMLFDGVSPLAGTPAVAARLAPTLTPILPACVLLSVTFAAQGSTLGVDQVGYLGAAGRSAQLVPRYGQALTQAGTDALRELLRQNLLPTRPQPGVRYLVAVPIDPAHPLYQESVARKGGGQGAVGATGTAGAPPATVTSLAQRGYPDARFIGEADGVQLYRIAEAANRYWFAMVRRMTADEPLLDYAGDAQPGGVATLGPVARQRLERMVLPLIRDTGGRQVTIEIRHYAEDVSIPYRPNSAYVNNEQRQHPTIGRTVEIPAAIERWTGSRAGSVGPYTWVSDAGFYTPYSAHNTLAAIQSAQGAVAAVQAANEAARAKRDEEEIVRMRAARAAMAAREQAKPARYAAAKLAYQPASYWSGYEMARELRAIHDGHYPDALRDWIFGRIYFRAVATYGDSCRKHLPTGSIKQTTITYRDHRYAGKIVEDIEEIYIHRDYLHVFDGWRDNKPGVPARYPDGLLQANPLTDLPGALAPGLEAQRVIKALRADFARFFEQDCTSPTLVQFMQNLRRLGDGEPTLQAERVPDLLPQPGDAPTTVAEACAQFDRDQRGPQNTRYCNCLDRVLTPRYSAAELEQKLENYSRFIEQASYPPGGDRRAVAHPDFIASASCRRS